MESFIRKYNKYNPKRIYNDLTKKEAFELELEIYKRVSGEKNFPKLINYDIDKMFLEIEHCGKSLDKLSKINIKNPNEQIENIDRVLKKYNIKHLDLHNSGKNICYKDGEIYLIDFDIAIIDNKPLSKKLSDKNKEIDVVKILNNILSKKIN